MDTTLSTGPNMTSENNLELFKLDATDRKVLFWMMDRNPQALRSWIDYIAEQHTRSNKSQIDADRLFQEVIVELPDEGDLNIRKAWRPKNILLVDDETIFNFLHKRMLELTGVTDEIHTTLNGVQAMDFLQGNSRNAKLPDIIMLDLSMPVMDGFAFLDAFQKIDLPGKENITVIVVTSSIDQRDRLKAKEMGITHYLIKPVDELELYGAVIGK